MKDAPRSRRAPRTFTATRWLLIPLALAAVSAATLPGCSSAGYRDVRITTDYDDHADFSVIRTWAWLPKPPAPIKDPRVHDETAYARLRRIIATELGSRGLKPAADGKPDVWVHHAVWLMDRKDLRQVGVRPADREAEFGTSTDDDEGGLMIEILDGRNRKRIWVAQVRAFLELEVSPDQKEARVRSVVRQMFEEFPPKAWRKAIEAE